MERKSWLPWYVLFTTMLGYALLSFLMERVAQRDVLSLRNEGFVAGIGLLVVAFLAQQRETERPMEVEERRTYAYRPTYAAFFAASMFLQAESLRKGVLTLAANGISSQRIGNLFVPIVLLVIGSIVLICLKNYRLTTTPEGIEVISFSGKSWKARWEDLKIDKGRGENYELSFDRKKAWAQSSMADFGRLRKEIEARIARANSTTP